MIRTLLFTLSCLLTSSIGFSQITVTGADFASPVTDVYMFKDTVVNGLTVPTGSATAQTWDYSALQYDFYETLTLDNPASTPNASNFPSATHVVNDNGLYTYLKLTANGLYLDGLDGDVLGQGVNTSFNINPDIQLLNLPANYGDSFISESVLDSAVAGSAVGQPFDSIRLTRRMVRETEIDAFGDVTTPAGTFTTLRVFTKETTYDTLEVQIFGTWQMIEDLEDSTFTYQYIANNEDFFVLELETDARNGNILNADYKSGDNLIAATQINPTSCHGDADGGATAAAFGGSGTYAYTWSDGTANGNQVTDLSAGTYTVTVTDGVNTVTETFTVTEPAPITLSANTTPSQNGMSNGSIEVTASGGTPGYSFLWSNGGGTAILNNIPEGTYEVTVTDANLCTKIESFTIGTTGVETLEESAIQVFPNPTVGTVNILAEDLQIQQYKVYSLIGNVVMDRSVNNLSQLELTIPGERGIYFLEVTTSEGMLIKKLVKQ